LEFAAFRVSAAGYHSTEDSPLVGQASVTITHLHCSDLRLTVKVSEPEITAEKRLRWVHVFMMCSGVALKKKIPGRHLHHKQLPNHIA
jgi:hypothetical protein